MTDSSPEFDATTEIGLDEVSPLRAVALESHEIYEELGYAGFSDRAKAEIVAHYLYDYMSNRLEEGESYDEDDDEDDEDVWPDEDDELYE